MLENRSQKIIIMIAVLVIFALACTTAATGGGEAQPTDDGLATVLAGVGNATQNANATLTAMPDSTDTSDQDEDAAPTATGTEDAATPESAITETPTITNTPSGYPTAIPLPNPQASNFYTCLTGCQTDGSNHQTSFPEKIEIIYFQFAFTEFPVSAPYSRAWYKDGVEWVRYDCYWPGPEEGIENITLTDPLGLPSGTWNLVVTINGEQVLNESLTIQGSWSQWSPPGHFTSCYGKR